MWIKPPRKPAARHNQSSNQRLASNCPSNQAWSSVAPAGNQRSSGELIETRSWGTTSFSGIIFSEEQIGQTVSKYLIGAGGFLELACLICLCVWGRAGVHRTRRGGKNPCCIWRGLKQIENRMAGGSGQMQKVWGRDKERNTPSLG